MSNLSDLLPAGAAAKQLTFTDSGSGIATKKPVILNSDGTVAEVGATTLPIAVGSAIDFSGGASTGKGYYASVCYDTANDKIFIAYADAGNSNYGTGVVCTVSGTTLSVGTPVVFEGSATTYPSCCFDSSNNKVFIAYSNSGGQGEAKVATISGTSVSYGTSSRIDGGNPYKASYIEAVYDANAGKVFTAYYDSYNVGAYGTVHTISGTGFSSGSPASFGSYYYPLGITYDSTAQKIITTIQTSANTLFSVPVTISGTNWSYGTYLSIGPCNGSADVSYDPVQDKTLQYFNDSTANTGKVAVLSLSGTTLSSGSQVNNTGSSEGYIKAVYNAASASHVIMWSTGSAGKARDVTISGTTPTLNATTTDWSSDYLDYIGAAYDEDQKVTVIATANDVAPKCYAIAYQSSYVGTNLLANNFVGVADSAISASAAGSVIVQGGTVSGVSEPESLTFGSSSVFESATAIDICAAFDSSNNVVVFAYKDSGNSPGQGTAVVATVSGTSLTYGTPVVFETDETREPSIAFDSNENKVVIAYREDTGGASQLGKAVVGTVSGTSISFGTAVQFSTTNASDTATTFDSNSNKVVIGYKDTSNSNYGTAVVGTVSGTSISFGTPVVFETAASATYGGASFDSTSNQVVFCYAEGANEKSILGAVSGTSISFGSATTIHSNGTSFRSVSFDSTNNRVVATYSDASTGKGMSAIGTVSGTSISYGTPVVAESASTGYVGSAFDVSNGRMLIVVNASSSGIGITGTVSGTTITFDSSSVTFLSGDSNYVGAVYDSNATKVVVSYGDASNSNYGTGIVASYGTTPLTVGTKYFVTPTGGFSSSAGTPSVNAGLAISTTSLLLNGDS